MSGSTAICGEDTRASGGVLLPDAFVPVEALGSAAVELPARRASTRDRPSSRRIGVTLAVAVLGVAVVLVSADVPFSSSRRERGVLPDVARTYHAAPVRKVPARPRAGRRLGRRVSHRRSPRLPTTAVETAPVHIVQPASQPATLAQSAMRVSQRKPEAVRVTCEFEPSCNGAGAGP